MGKRNYTAQNIRNKALLMCFRREHTTILIDFLTNLHQLATLTP